MNAILEQDMKEAIGKHLPQAVGDVLQERLRQADADAATVVRQKEQLTALSSQIDDLRSRLNANIEEVKKHGALAAREEAVATRERNAEISELKTQLAASTENTAFARSVALGLVRNIEYRSSVFDNKTISTPIIPENNGGYQAGTATGSENSSVLKTHGAD